MKNNLRHHNLFCCRIYRLFLNLEYFQIFLLMLLMIYQLSNYLSMKDQSNNHYSIKLSAFLLKVH